MSVNICHIGEIKRLLIIKSSDISVSENGDVRIKRKYGKLTRSVQVIEYYENDIGVVESVPTIEFKVYPPTKRIKFK